MKTFNTLLGITLLFGSMSQASADEYGNYYAAHLMPLNDSNVYAKAEVNIVNGNVLMVSIDASGLETSKLHPQHIHGFMKPVKNANCPSLQADIDGDGFISVGEGASFFGPIIMPLVPFNLVDDNGDMKYHATFTIKQGDFQPLHKRTIVLHGMTVNDEYIPSLPIACGELQIM